MGVAHLRMGVKLHSCDYIIGEVERTDKASFINNMSVKCRKWVLKSHFSGMPKREDLEIVEEELPPLKDGG